MLAYLVMLKKLSSEVSEDSDIIYTQLSDLDNVLRLRLFFVLSSNGMVRREV